MTGVISARQRPRLPLTREVDSPKAKTEGEKTKIFLRFVLSPSQLTLTAPSPLSVTAYAVPPLPAGESLALVRGGQGPSGVWPLVTAPPSPHTFSYKEERL